MSQHSKVFNFDSEGCSHASAVDSPKCGHKGGQLGLFGTRPSFVFQPYVSYLCFCKTSNFLFFFFFYGADYRLAKTFCDAELLDEFCENTIKLLKGL